MHPYSKTTSGCSTRPAACSPRSRPKLRVSRPTGSTLAPRVLRHHLPNRYPANPSYHLHEPTSPASVLGASGHEASSLLLHPDPSVAADPCTLSESGNAGTIHCLNGGVASGTTGNCHCDCSLAAGYAGAVCDAGSTLLPPCPPCSGRHAFGCLPCPPPTVLQVCCASLLLPLVLGSSHCGHLCIPLIFLPPPTAYYGSLLAMTVVCAFFSSTPIHIAHTCSGVRARILVESTGK